MWKKFEFEVCFVFKVFEFVVYSKVCVFFYLDVVVNEIFCYYFVVFMIMECIVFEGGFVFFDGFVVLGG